MYNQHEMMTGIMYIHREQLLLFIIIYIQYVCKQKSSFLCIYIIPVIISCQLYILCFDFFANTPLKVYKNKIRK